MKLHIRSLCGVLAVVTLLVLTITPSKAQANLKLGVGIGATIPTSDFNESTSEFYNGSRYGLGSGPNIDRKTKVGLSGWSLVG